MKQTPKAMLVGALLSSAIGIPQSASALPHDWHAPRGEVLDDRYHHGYFYPRTGRVVSALPVGYRTYWFHGVNWYLAGGVWYLAAPGGFVVARPPVGLTVTLRPAFATTVWIAGVPYYYANDVYYRWDSTVNGYEVVDAPPGADQPETAPTPAPDDVFIYPRSGQGAQQQAADRYECHTWASSQTGFDPTRGGANPAAVGAVGSAEQYHRALSACLEARGYGVK